MFYRGYGYYYQDHLKNQASSQPGSASEQKPSDTVIETSKTNLAVFMRLVAVLGVAVFAGVMLVSLGPQA